MSDHRTHFRSAAWMLGGMALGIVVTLLSVTWMVLAKPADVWSLEEAKEYQAAGEALHGARSVYSLGESSGSDRLAHNGASTHADRLAAAKERFDRISDGLERARNERQNWGRWGAGAGLALTIACGLGYLAASRE